MGSEVYRPGLEHQASVEGPSPSHPGLPAALFYSFFNQPVASICKLYGCEVHYKEKC